jgi:hypothetical protein
VDWRTCLARCIGSPGSQWCRLWKTDCMTMGEDGRNSCVKILQIVRRILHFIFETPHQHRIPLDIVLFICQILPASSSRLSTISCKLGSRF